MERSSKSWPTEEARRPREASQEDTATETDTVSRIPGLHPPRTTWDTCQRQAFRRERRRTEEKKDQDFSQGKEKQETRSRAQPGANGKRTASIRWRTPGSSLRNAGTSSLRCSPEAERATAASLGQSTLLVESTEGNPAHLSSTLVQPDTALKGCD